MSNPHQDTREWNEKNIREHRKQLIKNGQLPQEPEKVTAERARKEAAERCRRFEANQRYGHSRRE